MDNDNIMTTIEELLGASTEFIAKMTDEELKEYLKEITNLEPTPLPAPLGTKLKNLKDEDEEDGDSDNPIKSLKKCPSKLKKLKLNPQGVLDNLKKEIDDL